MSKPPPPPSRRTANTDADPSATRRHREKWIAPLLAAGLIAVGTSTLLRLPPLSAGAAAPTDVNAAPAASTVSARLGKVTLALPRHLVLELEYNRPLPIARQRAAEFSAGDDGDNDNDGDNAQIVALGFVVDCPDRAPPVRPHDAPSAESQPPGAAARHVLVRVQAIADENTAPARLTRMIELIPRITDSDPGGTRAYAYEQQAPTDDGLTRYRPLDIDSIAAPNGSIFRRAAERERIYAHITPQGDVETFITCGPTSAEDLQCKHHYLLLPDIPALVTIHYPYAQLPRWRDTQRTVSDTIRNFVVAPTAASTR